MKNKTIKNSIFNFIKTIATFLFPMITFSYISRVFLADGIGRINFAKSFIGIFSMIAMLGIRFYGIRECAKRRDDKDELSKTFSQLLVFNFISLLLAYIVLIVFVFFSKKTKGYITEIELYSVTMLISVISIEWLYIALEDYKYLAFRSIFIQAMTLGAVFLFVRNKEDIYVYIVIQVLSSFLINAIGLIHARKYVHFVLPKIGDVAVHLKPVLALFVVMMFIQIFTDINTVMLGYLANDTQVGLYSSAYKMSGVICSFISAITTVIMPRIAYEIENEDEATANRLLKHAIQFLLLVGIPLSVGTCIYSKNFILILSGEGFVKATPLSMVLSLRSFLSPINGMLLTHYLIQRNKDKEAIIITATAAGFNIIMNALTIPHLGAMGTSLSTVCAEVVEMIFIFIFVKKYLDIREVFSKGYQYLLCVLPVIVVAIAAKTFISNIVLSVLVGAAAGGCIYFLLLYLIKNEYFLMGIELVKNMRKKDVA